jgi:hypothetical protein
LLASDTHDGAKRQRVNVPKETWTPPPPDVFGWVRDPVILWASTLRRQPKVVRSRASGGERAPMSSLTPIPVLIPFPEERDAAVLSQLLNLGHVYRAFQMNLISLATAAILRRNIRPLRRERRHLLKETGLNPRALGTNPRALGTNPRAMYAKEKAAQSRTTLDGSDPSGS